MLVLRGAVVLLFMLSLPTWLVASNLRLVINRVAFYEYEFQKHEISSQAGIKQAELLKVPKGLIPYFESEDKSIDLQVEVNGNKRQLFNEKEVAHLRDVKDLVRQSYRIQAMALAYMLGYFAVSYGLKGMSRLPGAAKLLVVSSVATVGLMAVIGLGVFLQFDALFKQFHLLSFTNDFWLLDPRTDYLVRIFPAGFFY
ncbi:MAG: TIGR01906 family membrane protein, partial [Chloroflexota bacterium]